MVRSRTTHRQDPNRIFAPSTFAFFTDTDTARANPQTLELQRLRTYSCLFARHAIPPHPHSLTRQLDVY